MAQRGPASFLSRYDRHVHITQISNISALIYTPERDRAVDVVLCLGRPERDADEFLGDGGLCEGVVGYGWDAAVVWEERAYIYPLIEFSYGMR